MNTFGISVFTEPQQMIALYLGMKNDTNRFLIHTEKLLQRTKSPPIAITYTYHFLKDKTEQELSLDVIRFISQLADISQGVSMSSSLNGILDESNFLTQLRHSLTHKTMVKGTILLLSKNMIIDELDRKFWRNTIEKLKDTYYLSVDKVKKYYQIIFNSDYVGDISWIVNVHSLDYFKTCSNYEYKEHIMQVILDFKLNRILVNQFLAYYESVSQQKQTIFIIILLKDYLEALQSSQPFIVFLSKFVKSINPIHYDNDLVMRQCFKAYFLKYLPYAKFLFELFPSTIQKKIQEYWKDKEKEVGKLYICT